MLYAEDDKSFITISKGTYTIIMLNESPPSDQGFIVYRKGVLPDDKYIALNPESPVRPFLDPDMAASFLVEEWSGITDALETEDAFDVLRKIRSGFAGKLVSLLFPKAAVVAGRLFVDSTAVNGKEYFYKILYVDEYFRSKDSLEKKVLIKEYIPRSPSNTDIETGDAMVKITWKYPAWEGDPSDLAFRFYIYRKVGKGNFERINKREILRNDKSALEYQDFFLNNGEEYSYYITAVDPVGNESKPSNIVKIKPKDNQPPDPPEGLSVKPEDGRVLLSWFLNTETDAAGYSVYRAEGSSKANKKLNKNLLPLETTFFDDSTALTGIQYFYSVTCTDKNGNESKRCNPVSAIGEDKTKPLPPSDLTAKFDKTNLLLQWKASKSKDVTGYLIYGGYDDLITRLTSEPTTNTTYNITGLEGKGLIPGKIYSVIITAVDKGFNESDHLKRDSLLVPDSDPPMAPQNVTARIIDDEAIEVIVNPSISPDVEKYFLYRGAEKDQKLIKEYTQLPILYNDKEVKIGGEFIYSALAVDKSGNKSGITVSNKIVFKQRTVAPTPFNIRAKVTASGVEITWNEVIDNQLSGYFIYRCTTPTGAYEKLNAQAVKQNKFSDTRGNKTFFYKVSSVNTSGNESPVSEYVIPR